MHKIDVNLGPVQETLLIPLLGRAEETRRPAGVIHDPKSAEIVAHLDYDFAKWKGVHSLIGTSIRTCMFDEEVRTFLDIFPDGTVVEIGCGLNTRYERLDNGRAHWIEFDLPDSMALRRCFFADDERRTMLDADMRDGDWLDVVSNAPGPCCFVSEAALIYLDNGEAERILRRLAGRFPGAWLITDTVSAARVETQGRHDAMGKMSPASWYRWRCEEPAALEALGMQLIQSRTLLEAPREVRAALPWPYRLMFEFSPWLVRGETEGYRVNRFIFSMAPH